MSEVGAPSGAPINFHQSALSSSGQKLKTVAEKIIARRAPTAIAEAEERVKTLKAAEDAAKLALDAAVAATNAAILELRAVRKAAGQ